MPDFEEMYFNLAAKVADAIELLTKAQQKGEESYINDSDDHPQVTTACDSQ